MLSLARRPGQKIRIGEDIILVVREIRGRQVKIGIEAPASVRVLREEIYEEMVAANREAISKSGFEAKVAEDRALTFPEGLPGFEGKQYLLRQRAEMPAVEWLVSVSEPNVALMVLDPTRAALGYEPKPKPAELTPIEGELEAAKIDCRVVMQAGEEPGQSYLNLFAPILINFSKSLAMQVPLVGSGHAVREPWPPKSPT